LRGLWEELDQYRPMPQCTCPIACTCLAMRNNKAFRAEDRIIKFLMGLNEDYQGVTSQVLLMDPLPQINKVFSMVMQQERKMQYNVVSSPAITLNDTASGLINAMDGHKQFGRGRGNGYSQGKGRGNIRVCSFCNRTNHTVETCYKKHGYPPNWGRGGGNSFANANFVDCEDVESKGSTSAGKNEESGMMLTKDQYQSLIALLEKSNVKTKGSANMMKTNSSNVNIGGKLFINNAICKIDDSSWIVDTGVTHHTCHNLHWFTDYREIKPISVTLPNKTIVEACHRGNVKLSDTLHIHDVLYLPDFAVNLISVSKLCKEQDCIVNFETNQCVIQEKKGMRKIGLTEEIDGLYYLKAEKKIQKQAKISSISVSNNKSDNVVPPGILWHLRLGHLSHECMNKMYSYISVSGHVACDICQMASKEDYLFLLVRIMHMLCLILCMQTFGVPFLLNLFMVSSIF
jgi:hypothetical protein